MTFESSLPIIKAFVLDHPWSTVEEIQAGTGLHKSTVNRQLTGGYNKITPNTFLREKVTRQVSHGDGKVRGSYKWTYSPKQESTETIVTNNVKESDAVNIKKVISHHPLHVAFWAGCCSSIGEVTIHGKNHSFL